MLKADFLPVFRISGSNYDIGLNIGRKFKERIHRAFKESKRIKNLRIRDNLKPDWLNRVEQRAKNHFPHLMDEISGIADGAGLEYRDVLAVNFQHAIPPFEDCSTVIFKGSEKILHVHNEDHYTDLGNNAYLLIVEMDNGTTFFAHAYAGCIPGTSFGFNSHGIVMSCNALPDPVRENGLPRILFGRSILEAKNLDDALKRALSFIPRSGGVSYNLTSMNEKRVINLETTADEGCITEIQNNYFRTNHYISDKFKDRSIPEESNSLDRYMRGLELISGVEKTGEGALQILSEDIIFFTSFRLSSGEELRTLCTALFEVDNSINLRLYPGKQEKKEFMKFSLSDLESGKCVPHSCRSTS
ncbi:MAG: C45 family autoproteolytic acyltransferase/hydrolase [Candidatus Hodarchaeota archaeon]